MSDDSMLPGSFKYLRFVNTFSAVIYFFGGAVTLCFGAFFLWIGTRSGEDADIAALSYKIGAYGLIASSIGFFYGVFFSRLNKKLSELDDGGRFLGITLYIPGLVSFPLGTTVYGIGLYFLTMHKETGEVLATERPQTIMPAILKGIALLFVTTALVVLSGTVCHKGIEEWREKNEAARAAEVVPEEEPVQVPKGATFDQETGNVYF